MTVDSPDNEGRDVSALIDWLAQQPEAQLDATGDPRVGMHRRLLRGRDRARRPPRSTSASTRSRPIIAWHSLLTASTRRRRSRAAGRAALTSTLGIPTSKGRWTRTSAPRSRPARATGTLSAEDRAWFDSRGPGDLVKQITIPTFLVEGTADTLFTLEEAITNYEILEANGVPAKMLWFCGGHGVCLTGAGPKRPHRARRGRLAEALRRGRRDRRHRPEVRVAGRRRPVALGGRLSRRRRRAADHRDRQRHARAEPRRRRLRHASPPPAAPPTPSTSRSPRPPPPDRRRAAAEARPTAAPAPATHVFAQIVDETRGVVVGNQVHADPGHARRQAAHDRPARWRAIAASLTPQSQATRCRSPAAARSTARCAAAAAMQLSRRRLSIPTVGAGAGAVAAGVLPGSRRCLSRRSFVIRLHEPRHGRLRLRGTRVTVAGRRVKVFRKRGRIRPRRPARAGAGAGPS